MILTYHILCYNNGTLNNIKYDIFIYITQRSRNFIRRYTIEYSSSNVNVE